jgi:hypothetical protein
MPGVSPSPDGKPVPPMPVGDKTKAPGPETPDADVPEYLLVRFVDVGLEAGKTYKYFIQVRLENPNFGNKKEVASPKLAEIRELLSHWTETPSQRVEDDYTFYVVDQFHLDKPAPSKENPKGFVIHPGTKDTAVGYTKNRNKELIAVQIHHWVESGTNVTTKQDEKIGAWAIAERVLVKRGQYLGFVGTQPAEKPKLEVYLPFWKETTGTYEVPSAKKDKNNKDIFKPAEESYSDKSKQIFVKQYNGMEVEMFPSGKVAPLVIDFKGGEDANWPLPDKSTISEKAAIELLVLSPDGKLLSFNSREDSDPLTPRGGEREKHYHEWKTFLEAPSAATAPTGPGGKGLPGVGPAPPK